MLLFKWLNHWPSKYVCDINTDTDFETSVHALKAYFGFFRLQSTCETILRFYSYDGTTNYFGVRWRTGGLQGDWPEFMVFCLVTVHLWGRILGNIQKLKVWLTTTMSTSSRHFRQTPNSSPCWLSFSKKMETSILISARQRSSLRGPRQTICFTSQNISSTPILTLQILLIISLVTCSRLRVLKHLELRWSMTFSLRLLWSKTWLSQNHARYRKTWLPHWWFRSYSTIEILRKYTHTIQFIS